LFAATNAFAQQPQPQPQPDAQQPPPVVQAKPIPKPRYTGSMDDYYKANTLDLDISGGGGYFTGGPGRGVGFARVRAGILFARWPISTSIGTTFEVNNLSAATYGLQLEFLHIGMGVWLQLGAMMDGRAQFGGLASLGWSFLGVEAQVRGYDQPLPDRQANDGYGFAILGKVRIPLGFILYAMTRK
jgi:hypothetical protein